jgi:hypothetical protein
MLLVVLAVCVPANADVLIYKKTLRCWDSFYLGDGAWDVDNPRVRGYFILDVNYAPDGTFSEIVGSAQVDYWRDREDGKVYEVIDHDFDIIRVVDNRSIIWVLVQGDADEGDIDLIMLRGKAQETYIGSATEKEAPKKIDGDQLFYWNGGGWMVTCEWSLRFYKKFTEWSNVDENDLDAAINNIELWLESKGYEED